MESRDVRPVDDLRRQLRALGYLEAGVDRFVLGPARGARQPSSVAALASLRVGLLTGMLLGPAAAVGIVTRLPGLVTGPRDAVLIAVYLGAIFGIATAVAAFVLSILFARASSHTPVPTARRLSRVAGGVAAVGCLAYLTLWWHSANAGLSWNAPIWTAFALIVAVAISLLVGHAVAITTFAVMAARGSVEGVAAREDRTPWRLVVIAGFFAFAGAAALLFWTTPTANREVDQPPLAVVSPGVRVTLVAIDGFDPDVYESLRSAGKVAALEELFSGGVARFSAGDTSDPARSWMTVATAQPPEVHGVGSLETRRIAGMQGAVASGGDRGVGRALRGTTDLLRLTRPSIASGAELRTKPFWEVAADAGLRAAVVNWWATWPAPEAATHAPIVITDRAALRLARGGALDSEIAPKALYERLRAEWHVIEETARTTSEAVPSTASAATDAILRRSAELDALQLDLARRLRVDKPDLLAVYLPGLDIAQHTLLGPVEGAAPSTISARLEAVRGYYSYLDRLLKDFVRPGSNDEVVVVVTQPGRLSSAASGVLAVNGPIAARRSDLQARAVDVAPTVLHVLGLPVSRELAGTPVTQLLASEFNMSFPVRHVATYGPRHRQVIANRGDPLDAEAIERLRSLGYVR